jgi:hypothetical protein
MSGGSLYGRGAYPLHGTSSHAVHPRGRRLQSGQRSLRGAGCPRRNHLRRWRRVHVVGLVPSGRVHGHVVRRPRKGMLLAANGLRRPRIGQRELRRVRHRLHEQRLPGRDVLRRLRHRRGGVSERNGRPGQPVSKVRHEPDSHGLDGGQQQHMPRRLFHRIVYEWSVRCSVFGQWELPEYDLRHRRVSERRLCVDPAKRRCRLHPTGRHRWLPSHHRYLPIRAVHSERGERGWLLSRRQQ